MSIRLNRNILAKIDIRQPWAQLSTWFGCGLLLPGPGTWGTLGGLPFAVAALWLGGWPGLLVWLVIVTGVGYWAADKFERASGEHDAGAIVIDEVAGIALTMVAGAASWPSAIAAFLLFRFFDILKPWPVSWCDQKLPGALGVMVDDLAAGLLAGICLAGLRYAGLG